MFDDLTNLLHRWNESVGDFLDRQSGGPPPRFEANAPLAVEVESQWMDETTLHPLGVSILLIASVAVFGGKRSWAMFAFLFMACCVSGAQNINLFGTSLYLLRILITCGTLRCLLRKEYLAVRWGAIDKLMAAWAVVGTILFIIQRGQPAAVIYKIGAVVDTAGAYFVFRCLLQNRRDVENVILSLAVIVVPISFVFLFESITQTNLFSIFGGVPEFTVLREGRLRCQGAFAHPILAGVFWASNLPIFGALVISGKARILGALACGACLLIIYTCASSTPVMGVGVGMLGMGFMFLRKKLRIVQYGTLALLCGLHLCMKTPVWHLFARVDVLGGSTGYYRYILIDGAVRHFSEWCLVGLESNEHWGADYGHYLTDITNQYILEGLRGGALTLILFVAVIWCAFAGIGRRIKMSEGKQKDWFVWSFGASLFVHCVCFTAVSYFGQSTMLFKLHLAIIAFLTVGWMPENIASRSAGRILGNSSREPRREPAFVTQLVG